MKAFHSVVVLAGLGIICLVATIAAQAVPVQAGASATANANATIIAPIAIQKTADLNFGQVVAHTGGQVVIAPSGSYSITGSAEAVPSSTHAAASFTVTGNAGNTYAITLPSSTVLTSGSNSITVDTFTSTPSSTGSLTNGTQTVNVGATLEVTSNQAVGSYTGTFTVMVQYN